MAESYDSGKRTGLKRGAYSAVVLGGLMGLYGVVVHQPLFEPNMPRALAEHNRIERMMGDSHNEITLRDFGSDEIVASLRKDYARLAEEERRITTDPHFEDTRRAYDTEMIEVMGRSVDFMIGGLALMLLGGLTRLYLLTSSSNSGRREPKSYRAF